MFVEITNAPRDYAWGSTTLIPELFGVAPDGQPQAEIWLGTHPASPSRLVGREGDLRDVAGELPFLLKILAAGSPLSLQAHPTTAQAQDGFARENAVGIPIDASHRNYKDPYAKPEMIYALSDEFRALCGFRPVAETRTVLDAGRPGLFADLRSMPTSAHCSNGYCPGIPTSARRWRQCRRLLSMPRVSRGAPCEGSSSSIRATPGSRSRCCCTPLCCVAGRHFISQPGTSTPTRRASGLS
jgi:hypothetical protein